MGKDKETLWLHNPFRVAQTPSKLKIGLPVAITFHFLLKFSFCLSMTKTSKLLVHKNKGECQETKSKRQKWRPTDGTVMYFFHWLSAEHK